jgi:hypothetical protein
VLLGLSRYWHHRTVFYQYNAKCQFDGITERITSTCFFCLERLVHEVAMAIVETQAARPQLFFFSELAAGESLLGLLEQPGVLDTLAVCGAGVALALTSLDDERAAVAQALARRGIPCVAWICLPEEEGFALNLANYPRALARYEAMREWAQAYNLQFAAVGLAIEPPSDAADWSSWRALRNMARGIWLARDNALYPAARAAYLELIATMRRDGYEIHTYQLPFVADDRWADATLMQRALDILDLPSDVDVLLCGSDVPIDWLGGDLGGALIASYGPVADALGVGVIDLSTPSDLALPWSSLQRDLLLACQHTDTIYIASLEHCIRAGLLGQIAALNWQKPARAWVGRLIFVQIVRSLGLGVLLAGRYGRGVVAWAGWLLALIIWIRQRRRRSFQRRL